MLVVEQDERTAETLRRLAGAEQGFEVETSAQLALQRIREERFGVVVAPARRPGGGPSGADLCRALKERPWGRETPFLLVVDFDDVDELVEAVASGADDLLRACSPEQLLQRVGTAIACARRRRLGAAAGGRESTTEARLLDLLLRTFEHCAAPPRSRPGDELTGAAGADSSDDKHEAVALVAAGAGHDIGNPAAVALLNAQMTKSQLGVLRQRLAGASGASGAIGEEVRAAVEEVAAAEEMIEDALQGLRKIEQLLDDVRAFARPSPVERQALDLNGVVAAACEQAGAECASRAHIVQELEPLPRVAGDVEQLQQAVTLLLRNGVLRAPPPSSDPPRITVSTRALGGGRVLLAVEDPGPPISVDDQRHLFDPYGARWLRGGGAGGFTLAWCRELVRQNGGSLELRVAPEKPVRFEINLPVINEPVHAATPPAHPRAATRKGRVLVVDDEPQLLRAVRRLLAGFDVVLADSGAAALARLEHDADFDVILCDLMMPDVGGRRLFEVLRTREPELARRMLFWTGGAMDTATEQFASSLGDRVLGKPLDMNRLLAVIAPLLRR